jgi:hypothetical protein
MSNLKQTITALLLENTGKHMLDSGGDHGRMWQKNQGTDFDNEDRVTFDDNYPIVSLYHYLNDILEVDDLSDRINEYINNFNSDLQKEDKYSDDFIHWTGNLIDSEILDMFNAENVSESFNTCNHESFISQECQYFTFSIEDEVYIALQVHGGADIRGGYTGVKVFKLNGYFTGSPDVYATIMKSDGTEIQAETGYNGYSLTTENGEDIEIEDTDSIAGDFHIMEDVDYLYLNN